MKRTIKALIRKKFNRDKPFLLGDVEKRVAESMAMDKPIRLVGFWGVGEKDKTDDYDIKTCRWLAKLNEGVKKFYSKGISFVFIIATEHGKNNGIDDHKIASYSCAMEKLFKEFGFEYIYLKDLWDRCGISFEKIDELHSKKPLGWWEDVPRRKLLEKNAKNRNLDFHYTVAAQRYYIMRNLEKAMLEKEFGDCIFHSFSDARLDCVLPHMPRLYLYARKGWSNAPWFMKSTWSFFQNRVVLFLKKIVYAIKKSMG